MNKLKRKEPHMLIAEERVKLGNQYAELDSVQLRFSEELINTKILGVDKSKHTVDCKSNCPFSKKRTHCQNEPFFTRHKQRKGASTWGRKKVTGKIEGTSI